MLKCLLKNSGYLLLIFAVNQPAYADEAGADLKKKEKRRATSFTVKEDGSIIPVAKNGTPYEVCGDDKINTCSLMKPGATVTGIEVTTITRIEHKINPTCLVYAVLHAGEYLYFYDPSDPHCAHLNN